MIRKIILAIRSIRNLHLLVLDLLGIVKGDILYRLWDGSVFSARAGSTDISEIIINTADSEYPSDFYPKDRFPIIFDIGANIGETAIFMYQRLKTKQPKIYAFEPSSPNFHYLAKNIKLNHAEKSIFPFKLAVTGKSGKGLLHYSGGNFDGGFINDTRAKSWTKSEKISTVSLIDFCKNKKIKRVDLLKMDIEGSEYEVFANSMTFIKKNVKSIFVELHNLDEINNYTNFKKLIQNQGFSVKAEIMNRTLFLSNDLLNTNN